MSYRRVQNAPRGPGGPQLLVAIKLPLHVRLDLDRLAWPAVDGGERYLDAGFNPLRRTDDDAGNVILERAVTLPREVRNEIHFDVDLLRRHHVGGRHIHKSRLRKCRNTR